MKLAFQRDSHHQDNVKLHQLQLSEAFAEGLGHGVAKVKARSRRLRTFPRCPPVKKIFMAENDVNHFFILGIDLGGSA